MINSDFHDVPVGLRPPRLSDARAFRELRAQNEAWLRSSAQSNPDAAPHNSPPRHVRSMARPMRELVHVVTAPRRGRALPWTVTYGGQVVGQLTISSIVWGSTRSGEFGGWIDEKFARQGIMGTALAMAVDYCFHVAGFHRLETFVRPENAPLRRSLVKYGFREEGLKVRLTHIDGSWRDHVSYAVTVEDLPEGAVARRRAVRAPYPISVSTD